MQTLKDETTDRPIPTPEEIRTVLLTSARRAGDGEIHVRGVDLVTAITGTFPGEYEPAR